ncbi:MAG: hypothetical protein Q4G28_00310 [Neisseria sp.]|nr:hypothetical protein [Neisseria sp.]
MNLPARQQHTDVVSVKEWLLVNIVFVIPVVNIVMALVWAFSSRTNPSKANYSKAVLILWLVWTVFVVIAVLSKQSPAG